MNLPVPNTGRFAYFRGAIAIYDELKDPLYHPPTLMRKMVAMGWYVVRQEKDSIPIFDIQQEAT